MAFVLSDHHVGGLNVSVNYALLVGVLDGVTDLDEQSQAFFRAEIVFVAVFGYRDAGD